MWWAAGGLAGAASAGGDEAAHGDRQRAGARPRGAAAGPGPQRDAAGRGALPIGGGGAWVEEEPVRESRSSNKMAGRRKRTKMRKQKLLKASSSTSSRWDVGVGHQGMHVRAEDEFEEEATTEYVQRAEVLINLHTVVSDTLHAEPLNSAHSKEVAKYLEEMNRFIEEKVIMREEFILKNGTPAMNVYSDRTHLYTAPSGRCWLDWRENRHQ